MSDFKAKMRQIRFQLGLRLQHSPEFLAVLKGHISKESMERKEREQKREGKKR